MLGREIVDAGTEHAEGKYPGLGLLDGTTGFSAYRKHTVRVRRFASDIPPILSKMQDVSGYEIHMGETDRGSDREALEGDGAVSGDGLVIGTYMHGLFQNPSAADALVSFLAQRKGVPHVPIAGREVHDPFDELARVFEEHVDMAAIESFFL
jgi:adenosylcobyric acid synthase